MYRLFRISALLIFSFLLGCDGNSTTKSLRVAIVAGAEGNAIKEVYAEYKGAKIDIVELSYGSLREQLVSTLSAQKSGFDVVMIDDPWLPQLSSNLKELKNIPQALTDDIVDKSLALGRHPYATGPIQALPFVGNTQLLFFRPDLLKTAGITAAPRTWDQVVSAAQKLSSNDQTQFGYSIRGRSGAPIVTDFLPIYWSLGGRLTESVQGRLINRLDRAKFAAALRIYKQLQQASPPGSSNFDWVEMTAALTRGTSAMELNWPAAIPEIERALPSNSTAPRWDVSLPPGASGPGTSMIGNWLLAIPLSSSKPEQAEDFILWLMDQQSRIANAGRPPTRKSVYEKMSLSKPYFRIILDALENSTPRDRTEKWPSIEDAVSRAVSQYLNNTSTETKAVDELAADLDRISR